MAESGLNLTSGADIYALGARPANTARQNAHWLKRGLANAGNCALYGPGTYSIDEAGTFLSNTTLILGPGVILDATTMSVACLNSTSTSNVRITGDGKIVCTSSSVPSFTSVTGLTVDVRIEDASGNALSYTSASNTYRPLIGPNGVSYTPSATNPSINVSTQLQMKKWRVALANAMNGKANAKLAFLGDSVTAGYGAANAATWTGARTYAMPARIAALLSAGTGVNIQQGSTFCDAGTTDIATFALYDPRWSFGSGWATQVLVELAGGTAISHSAANTNAAAFTPTQAFDKLEIWVVTNTVYQDIVVNVDGGASLGTIDLSQALSVLKTTYTVALDVHTVNIAKSAGNANFSNVIGINTFDSATKAVQVWNMGYGGSTSGIWGTASSAVYLAPQLVATYAPDLSVICLGINDYRASVSYATFSANMQRLIDKCLISGSCMLVMSPPTQIGFDSVTQLKMDPIVAATRDLARTNNIPLVDLVDRFVSYTDANAYGLYGDGAHLTGAGYQDWANVLYPYIAP